MLSDVHSPSVACALGFLCFHGSRPDNRKKTVKASSIPFLFFLDAGAGDSERPQKELRFSFIPLGRHRTRRQLRHRAFLFPFFFPFFFVRR